MEKEFKNLRHHGRLRGIGFGLIIMVIGLLLLGYNTGLLSPVTKSIVFSLPMFLVALGVYQFFKRHLTPGIILILVGGFFIIPRIISVYPALFPGFSGDFAALYWPFLLIGTGIVLILNRTFFWNKSHYWKDGDYGHYHRHHRKYEAVNPEFEKNAVFGSGEYIVLDPVFKGGELNAVFGGITLDLRKTTIPEGETVIDVNSVFGGVTIYVPTDWLIELHVDPIFGGFSDTRLVDEKTMDSSRKLLITGACVFGGGEIRN